jgi:HrpA-like RNA helicase
MPLLIEQFASKASIKQRRGRAGRVREGTCYRLISQKTFDSLQTHSEPEIRRVALDQTLLQLLFLGVESGQGTFMKTLLDPPSEAALSAAAFSLMKLGAVEPSSEDERDLILTPMGSHLAGIPAPPIVGKSTFMSCSGHVVNSFWPC